MPVGTISLKYTTKNFPIHKTFDTRINVKDTVEYLRFSTVFTDGGVGVSFIDAPRISIEDNVLIQESTTQIANNAKRIRKELELFTDDFMSEFASFYITDIVTTVDGEDSPLYFKHDLSSKTDISNLRVLNADMTEVNSNLWTYIDETATLGFDSRNIYTNLQCSIDKRNSAYEIYYIKYRDNVTNEIVTELLDSKPFYSQSSFLTERSKREYIITELSTGYRVNVIFDSLNYSPTPVVGQQRFYVKNREKSKIYIEKPAATLASERWNLRISPGDFNFGGRRYWVPEYYTQLYSPTFPYKLEKEREVLILDNQLLYTDLFPIADLRINGFYLYIIMKDASGSIVQAITNDPDADTYITKQGFVTDLFYDKEGIQSISSNSGFIKLKEKVKPGLRAFVSYRYSENFFTYLDLSVNPSINADILGKRILMYVTPDFNTRSVHHLITDETGTILEASQTGLYKSFEGFATDGSIAYLEDTELPAADYFTGFELEVLSGLNSGIKVKISAYNDFKLSFADSLPHPVLAGTLYRILKKVSNYITVEPRLGQTYSYTGWDGIAIANSYLKLGDVFVTQNLNISDIKSYDSRILGGGLKTDKEEASLQLQDEARWYWDIGNFDGTPYPGMGSILVELPRYILKELGGSFEREQIKEIVQRHMGSGGYPVIKYYDASTEITYLEPGDGTVFIQWELIDASQYNIYIGNSADNVSLYQSQPGTRNTATVTGLENNKIYYVQIEPIVGGQARLRSRVMSFMPFNYSNTLPPIKYGQGKFSAGSYE